MVFLYLYRALLAFIFFFFNDPAPTEIYPLPLHDALPIYLERGPTSLIDHPPLGVGEVEERFDLKAAQIARQRPPPQPRPLPVVHVPVLPAGPHNSPPQKAEQQLLDLSTKSQPGC